MLPIAAPDLRGRESEYAAEAISSTWISSTGRYLRRMEEEFAQVCGVAHALAVSNGTAALHLTMLGLGIGPGDEVIVPSFTYIASVNAITYVGATPVLVDADVDTWCVDVAAVAAAVTDRTRAVVAVDLYGQPVDADGLRAAVGPDVRIIEDAAEAPLATYRGRMTGSLGDVGTFSFFGNKVLTSGEGGAVTLDDGELAASMRLIRDQGMDPKRRYYFPIVGYNFRMTNVSAAILCAQIERRDELLASRAHIYAQYAERLGRVRGLTLQRAAPETTICPWLFSVLVDAETFGCSRDELARRLAAVDVETRPFFIPVHQLPPYAALAASQGRAFPASELLGERGINLPTFSEMTDDDVDRVCSAIEDIAG